MDRGELQLTAKGRATRARILDTAAGLILRRGVAGTGIDDVRRAAGVSGSQMTHYFRDRDSLIHDVVEFQAESTLAQHQAPELDGFRTLASLRLWADLQIERQRQRDCQGGCSFGSLAGQLAESSPETRADLADGFTRWLALLQRGLEAMKATGELRADADPHDLAYALLATMQGGMLLTQTLRTVEPLEVAFDTVLARVASFATDPAQAAHILRLTPVHQRLLRGVPDHAPGQPPAWRTSDC
ncbi:MAG: TetR family transcriptional regulator C-terminal domain-containing protein [Actinobacteria bacterium]|nr:TetR family transcriptional regulator C-terminal domain-containing protein [Actinomycetota bacterium]